MLIRGLSLVILQLSDNQYVMKIEEKEPLTNLERELVKAVVGHLSGNFHKSTVVARIAAKIALDLAYDAYNQGSSDAVEYYHGRPNRTFKQFIQDYE